MDVVGALERLRAAADDGRLDAVCRARGVRLLTVFGSAVRDVGSAHDVDVAVSMPPGGELLGLVSDLALMTGTDAVDLMVLEGASPTARRNALVGALLLHEAEPGLFARTQMAASLEFYETEWMRRLDLERLAAP